MTNCCYQFFSIRPIYGTAGGNIIAQQTDLYGWTTPIVPVYFMNNGTSMIPSTVPMILPRMENIGQPGEAQHHDKDIFRNVPYGGYDITRKRYTEIMSPKVLLRAKRSKRLCRHFLQGHCTYTKCNFSHEIKK